MKLFHIGDVLSITTGRLAAPSGMSGVYAILNFLTGDNLFTHQLPRAANECGPWLRTQFPALFPEHSLTAKLLDDLDAALGACDGRDSRELAVDQWVEAVRVAHQLPEYLPVYELGADMHTHIDPKEELEAMVGSKGKIIIAVQEE